MSEQMKFPKSFLLSGESLESAKKITELTYHRQRQIQALEEELQEAVDELTDELRPQIEEHWGNILESVGLSEKEGEKFFLHVEFLGHGIAFLKNCGAGVDPEPQSEGEEADLLGEILIQSKQAGSKH